MKSEVKTVTPTMAERWLAANTDNRKLNPRTVAAFASDMATGRWLLNGETIKFGADGVLQDGQHRLWAILQSGVSVQVLVVTDLPHEARDTVDMGRTRTSGHILGFHGFANSTQTAAIVNTLLLHRDVPNIAWDGSHNPTKSAALAFALKNRSHLIRAQEASAHAKGARGNYSGYGAVAFLCQEDYPEQWAAFDHGVHTGEGLSQGDPALAFREYCIRTRAASRGTRWSTQTTLAVGIIAMNAQIAGVQRRRITYTASDLPMPSIGA